MVYLIKKFIACKFFSKTLNKAFKIKILEVYPSVPHRPLSSTYLFNTRITPCQHPKSVSSTHPLISHTLQFDTPFSSTNRPVQQTFQLNTPVSSTQKKPSVQHKKKSKKITLYKRALQKMAESLINSGQ